MGKSLEHVGTGENFLNRTPVAYALRTRIDKWNLIKFQSVSRAKDIVNSTKWQITEWETFFTNLISNRRPMYTTYTRNSRSYPTENQITLLKMEYRTKQRILN